MLDFCDDIIDYFALTTSLCLGSSVDCDSTCDREAEALNREGNASSVLEPSNGVVAARHSSLEPKIED